MTPLQIISRLIFLFFFVFFSLTGHQVCAQNIIFKGKLQSKEDNRPIAYASVILSSIKLYTSTNMDGEFSMQLPANTEIIDVRFSSIGFQDSSYRVQLSDVRETLIYYLEPMPITIEAVVVPPRSKKNIEVRKIGDKERVFNKNKDGKVSYISSTIPGDHVGVYILPDRKDQNRLNILETISLYVHEQIGNAGSPCVLKITRPHVRLRSEGKHLEKRRSTDYPTGETLYSFKSGWNTIDLKELNIPFDKNGLIISLRFIDLKENNVLWKNNQGIMTYGATLGVQRNVPKENIWWSIETANGLGAVRTSSHPAVEITYYSY